MEELRIKDMILRDLATACTKVKGFGFAFECQTCGQLWELVAPDGPMRGYLRTISTRELRILALRAMLGRE